MQRGEIYSHLTKPLDQLLADVAIRIQLSRTDYKKAVDRYNTISDWIERDSSPLKDQVELFYPQGSMAIGATIASKLATDEFDIDIAAEVNLPQNTPPRDVLDYLLEAIRGKPGSRYYRVTDRRTRCITVHYSDKMHLDVTPMIRRPETLYRESWIFHHQETQTGQGDRLVANPYGFAEWFKRKTPFDDDFARAFGKRAEQYELQLLEKAADTAPVPPQEPLSRKSISVIVLQLLKRWRNVQYDSRSGRTPPSIVIAKLVADAADETNGLSQELEARHLQSFFQVRTGAGTYRQPEMPRTF